MITINTPVATDPVHRTAVTAQPSQAAAVRYALDHLPRNVTTDDVRAWLLAHGLDVRRPYASGIINRWRAENGLTDTAGQTLMTDELIAELDALRTPVSDEVTPGRVQDASPVSTKTSGLALSPTAQRLLPTGQRGQSARRVLLAAIGILVTVVVIAPVSLSAQDLYQWAASPTGLGLKGVWPYLVFVATDAAAALCIAFTMLSAWRGESGGIAHLMVWAFAIMSAYANWIYGSRLASGHLAQDAVWFFPIMSLAGAVLLEITFRKVRHWVKRDAGVFEAPLPRFRATRWLFARAETFAAWKAAVTEGFSTPRAAIEHVRAAQAANTDQTRKDAS